LALIAETIWREATSKSPKVLRGIFSPFEWSFLAGDRPCLLV
jgi:hypothetical protein